MKEPFSGHGLSVEQVFRYFVTGAIVVAQTGLAYPAVHTDIKDELGSVTYLALVPIIGMCVYSVYHLFVKWLILDRIMFCLHWSAPALAVTESPGCRPFGKYTGAYSEFLVARFGCDNSEGEKSITNALSGYLYYLWALAHVALLLGF